MAAVNFKVSGIESVATTLENIARGVTTKSSRAVTDSCRRIVKTARALVPVRTGELQKSIGYTMRGRTLGVVGLTPPGSEYWFYVEFGTRYYAAHPFMRPACEAERAPFYDAVGRAVEDAINDAEAGATESGDGGGEGAPEEAPPEPELPIPE